MRHVFFLGHDNAQELRLLDDSTNLSEEQYDAITRVVITLALLFHPEEEAITLDSDEAPNGLIRWGSGGPGDMIRIDGSLLTQAGVTTGVYRARVEVYSVDAPNGLVWINYPMYEVLVRA